MQTKAVRQGRTTKESVMNKSSNGNYKAQTGQAASKIDDEYFKTR